MDNLFRLFCRCCTSDSNDADTPYRPLNDNDVMTIRDPPITNPNFYLNGNGLAHENGGYEAADGRDSSGFTSPTPTEQHKTDQEMEKDMLADILEKTQHNIIAVGQVDHNGIRGQENLARERKYEALIQIHQSQISKPDTSTSSSASVDYAIDFEFEPVQTPVSLPLEYETTSILILSQQEKQQFNCPNFQLLDRARHLGIQRPLVMMEHPDVKKCGKLAPIPKVMRQKLKDCAREIHSGVEACQIEHKTQLVVFMDL